MKQIAALIVATVSREREVGRALWGGEKIMKFFVGTMTLATMACISAQPLELKGLQIGVSTSADLRTKFPATEMVGGYATLRSDDHIASKCGRQGWGPCNSAAMDELRVAGGTPGNYTIRLLDSVIESIEVKFNYGGYDVAAGALKEKYGSPTTTDSSPSQNRMGATFANERLTWSHPTGMIAITKRGAKIDESRLTMVSARYLAYQRDAEAAKIKKGAKEL